MDKISTDQAECKSLLDQQESEYRRAQEELKRFHGKIHHIQAALEELSQRVDSSVKEVQGAVGQSFQSLFDDVREVQAYLDDIQEQLHDTQNQGKEAQAQINNYDNTLRTMQQTFEKLDVFVEETHLGRRHELACEVEASRLAASTGRGLDTGAGSPCVCPGIVWGFCLG